MADTGLPGHPESRASNREGALLENQTAATVSIITLGGTIAMTKTTPDTGVVPGLTAEDLLASLPQLDEAGVTLRTHDLKAIPGASMSFADLTELADLIEAEARAGVCGVIVTQGTDTIEETAFFLDISLTTEIPVVVTGAMRHSQLAGPDGAANLLAAIQVAMAPEARGLGCLVVMADEVHAAQFVRKTHTTSVTAFSSPNTGPLGYLVEGRLRILTRPTVRYAIPLQRPMAEPTIALVTAAFGDNNMLRGCLDGDLDGLVLAGFGVGHVPSKIVSTLETLAQRIPVIIASRITAGPVLRNTYGFSGSEQDLLRRGLLCADFLSPTQARILLRQLLCSKASKEDIAKAFG